MKYATKLIEKFSQFPFATQATITLGSVVVLVVVWSACGGGPAYAPPPSPPPPVDLAFYDYPRQPQGLDTLAFSPDGTRLAIAGGEADVDIWSFPRGRLLSAWRGHRGAVTAVAFRSDGDVAASASKDKTVKLWDVPSGRELRTLTGHSGGVTGVVFSPDGKTIVSISEDGTAKLWEVSSGRELRTFSGHTAAIRAVAFHPDGKTIATGSTDKTVRLWDISTGELVRMFTGPPQTRVSVLAFSPDGKLLVAGTAENGPKISLSDFAELFAWVPQTGQRVFASEPLFTSVTGLAFRPDGSELAFSYADYSGRANVEFLGMPGFLDRRRILAHTGPARAIAYSPDGKWLVSAGADRLVRVWKEP